MMRALVTSFSFVSLIAFVSCALNQETFSTSEIDKCSERSPDTNGLNLNAIESTGSLQTVDIAPQYASGNLIEPVTSLSMSPDLLTTIPAGSLSGYIFNLFYDDKECKGPAVSGFSVKLNLCIPNNDVYFFVTTTLTETKQTYYTDSLCTIEKSASSEPFTAVCSMGFKNIVEPTFVLPTKEPHVAIRCGRKLACFFLLVAPNFRNRHNTLPASLLHTN
jgi:hypothetical protein